MESRELYWRVNRYLGRRKDALGADLFEHALRSESQERDPNGLVRCCYAHALGSLRLPHSVRTLTDVVRSETVEELRFECARSLGRMRLPVAADALAELIPQLNNARVAAIARIGLLCCVHLTENPRKMLKMILDEWHPDAFAPIALRAIGLCGAGEYLERVDRALTSADGEVRGQAMLARARLGFPVVDAEARIACRTEHIESLLVVLADLFANGQSDVISFAKSIESELFDWSGLVIDDLRKITKSAPAEFKQQLDLWEPILEREAENLTYLYG